MIRAPVFGYVVYQGILNRRIVRDKTNPDLQQANSDTDGHTGAAERTLVIGDRPRVTCKGLQNASQLKLALLNGEEEPSGAESLLGHWLSRTRSSASGCAEPEHVLDLLWSVFFATAEDIGFAAFSIANFVELSLGWHERDDGNGGEGHVPWCHK